MTHLTEPQEPGRCDFQGSPRFHTIDLVFLNQQTLPRLIITEFSEKIMQFLLEEPTSVVTKPSVFHAEDLGLS